MASESEVGRSGHPASSGIGKRLGSRSTLHEKKPLPTSACRKGSHRSKEASDLGVVSA
ncbi:hypothetical protein B8V81_3737 [Paenibacillus pasadenensis]|uniref:Uncharacterized protein n=1 Tax=Paenibacillus pasadenensis TaxID=217090 RepID=A0A2N5N4M3_9BACL|nr:hypothetical protein B8V81_3737 [Paenibacillus pasadenensis]